MDNADQNGGQAGWGGALADMTSLLLTATSARALAEHQIQNLLRYLGSGQALCADNRVFDLMHSRRHVIDMAAG